MTKHFIWITLILLSANGSAQQKLEIVKPETQHFSSSKLKDLDNVLEGYVTEEKTPGFCYLIARNGKIVSYSAVGYSDVGKKMPLKTDAIYRIASQTKPIVSVAVMILVEEGKLMLEEPLSKYIPSFKNPALLDKFNPADSSYTTKPAAREIMIRDLLTQTSGIEYAGMASAEFMAIYHKHKIFGGPGRATSDVIGDVINRLGPLPLRHNPGEKFTYGLNTDVLGYLIEVVSGMKLDKFLKTRIFDPLGMNDTYFFLPENKYDRLVPAYTYDSTGKMKKVPEQILFGPRDTFYVDYPKTKGRYFSGGGGLSSTVMDYAIFCQMMLNGGEYNDRRILSRAAVRMMTTNQIGDINLGNDKFGYGFAVIGEEGSAKAPWNKGSFNWSGLLNTYFWVDPKEKLVAVFHKQTFSDPYWRTFEKFKTLVYAAITD